jgi:hypothetical protein
MVGGGYPMLFDTDEYGLPNHDYASHQEESVQYALIRFGYCGANHMTGIRKKRTLLVLVYNYNLLELL